MILEFWCDDAGIIVHYSLFIISLLKGGLLVVHKQGSVIFETLFKDFQSFFQGHFGVIFKVKL